MTTVIMMFILPIGIIVYFWDRKVYAKNMKEFHFHIMKIAELELERSEKIDIISKMFHQNEYTLVNRTDTSLIVEKKHINIGVPFIMFGLLAYIGLVLYFIYFFSFIDPFAKVILKQLYQVFLIPHHFQSIKEHTESEAFPRTLIS
ncbi:MAG: hypothetical protein IE918_06845 [Campylobacterales bacterium]|nr:hypothetical protein [Campylobacterales bacterium]